MYSTCLFCNYAKAHNESIELFPVGRRLAFDVGGMATVCSAYDRMDAQALAYLRS